MKHLFLLFLIVFAAWSCSKDEKISNNEYPQKWVLVSMTGQIPNSETTGENMEWQEYYLLEKDSSFIKQRIQDGIQTNGVGSFSFIDKPDGKYLELIYDTNSEIIGTCYSNNIEILWLIDNKLMGTWRSCDGPGLDYERVD